MLGNITINPIWATMLFVAAVVAGHLYRKNWKNEGPTWKLWLYGMIAGMLLMIVAFVPISI